MPTTVVLTFDQPLDPGSADDVRNYVILDPSGHRIRINRAVFDPTRLTVTLHPAQRISIHHPYQLIVNGAGPGAVSNMSGQPLDSVEASQSGQQRPRRPDLAPARAGGRVKSVSDSIRARSQRPTGRTTVSDTFSSSKGT